ncbi:omega-6 fatty acid desaturase (delta-12 desaturase) [Paenibacillus cellulosilyticus]|uniref:Omega-6 fatty acid desaturase (Delta-12 desaturase) n=1 Tax=Paenibacillus cellulosilyticus TaxID=375489 RepID=A0A2V2YST9_9BACL|nr:omega-6 fatty acid desaturase (delta-12 desaturase) [Paenibacillus cellulosilyticus]
MDPMNIAELKKQSAPYARTNISASLRQLANTLLPFLLLWTAAYASLSVSYWLTLPIAIVAASFLIRTFIIFHDCCHQSFFKSRKANDWLGNITGILTHFPYEQWKNAHNIHHATSGNLDKRGVGDMWILTVEEYIASPARTKLAYRLYRNPLVFLLLGPLLVFLVTYRKNRPGAKRREKLNTYMTNVAIVALYAGLCALLGWKSVLLVQVPILWVAGMMGIWLFYVQHQFEDSYFENDDEWSYVKAAVEGSSYYQLPRLLQWITGNIGFHHVHHLNPKVPNYNLEKTHLAIPPLQKAATINIRTSLQSLRFRLWDEDAKTFIGFRELSDARRKLAAKPKLPLNEEARIGRTG